MARPHESKRVCEHAEVGEARLTEGDGGTVPEGDGWFVLNGRDAPWLEREGMRRSCVFEGETRFPELGVNVNVLEPGRPSGLYHAEASQEDFLVLSGECDAVIEGEERRLRAWDFVHCPPGTLHSFVGAGDAPSVLLAVGARFAERGIRYEPTSLAPSVEEATSSARDAYAPYGHWQNDGSSPL